MEKYLKHPIILAIIVGAVIYILMSYFYNPKEVEEKNSKKSKKSKQKAKSGFFTDKRETTILVSAIAALGTWFLAKTYLVSNENDEIVDITGMNVNQQSVNPLVNSLLGPSAASNEAGIMNIQPQFQTQVQPQSQPQFQTQPQIQVQPQNQPTLNTSAIQQIQNAATELTNRANQQIQRTQQGGGTGTLGNNGFQSGSVGQNNRSYNLIGTGLDIPRSAIPKVLVDYN